MPPSPRLGTNSSAAAGGLEPFLQGGCSGMRGLGGDDLNLRGTCTRRRRRCELRTVELVALRRLQRRLAACLGAHFWHSALDFTGLPKSCMLWLRQQECSQATSSAQLPTANTLPPAKRDSLDGNFVAHRTVLTNADALLPLYQCTAIMR